MPKQTIVQPSGIITQPNEYGEVPPGSLSVGDGIQIRRQSVIEPRNQFMGYSMLDATYNQAMKLWPLPADVHSNTFVVARDGTNTRLFNSHSDPFGSVDPVAYDGVPVVAGVPHYFSFSPGKAHFSDTRQRTIITSNDPPAITHVFGARQAGLPAPFIYAIGDAYPNRDWVIGNYLAYAAVFRREESDGYIARGPVSPKLIAVNGGGIADAGSYVHVSWSSEVVLPPGTVLELYRVPQQTSSALLGDDFRLSFEYALTATDVNNHYVEYLMDPCLDTALGAYLYVNAAQDGADKTNNMPPQSNDVFTFKGATFYVSSDITQQFATRVLNKWGVLVTPGERSSGIGTRSTTATYTTGVTTITVADPTGIVVGQIMDPSGGFPDNPSVVGVSGTSITLSMAPFFTGPDTVSFYDQITIDGIVLSAADPGAFVSALGLQIKAGNLHTLAFSRPALELSSYLGIGTVNGPTLTFTQSVPQAPPFFLTATNGQNYSPRIAEWGTTPPTSSKGDPRTNRVHFSKIEAPEAVPPSNFEYVGHGTILKLWGTQDSLFAFCTDGIYRIDGDGDDWSVKPFDPDTVLLAPDAVASLNDQIYALTNNGFVSVTDSGGVQKISALLIHEDFRTLWNRADTFEVTPPQPYTWAVQVAGDKFKNEVWINFNDYADTGHIKTYIWSPITKTFVTQSWEQPVAIAFAPSAHSIILGDSELRQYDLTKWMSTHVEFNSVTAEDVGYLKQWVDVTLFLEDVDRSQLFTPVFESVAYSDSYVLDAKAGAFDHVIAPLLDAIHKKHMRFGYYTEGDLESIPAYYRLKGLAYRYRMASEVLNR